MLWQGSDFPLYGCAFNTKPEHRQLVAVCGGIWIKMKVLLLCALVIVSLSSSFQGSPRRPKSSSSQAHPVVPRNTTQSETQEHNATETHNMEKNEIETYCMITLVVVLFFFFAAIAAVQEYKQSDKKVRLADNQNREDIFQNVPFFLNHRCAFRVDTSAKIFPFTFCIIFPNICHVAFCN
ncbi:hypothetical protein L5515_009634 [Caenorhabditis briggsae]|uniref:Uncharacterized protein n=1 Tax=Caenorhabditis briggsae TaxID=6238 RepID=A0AAE9JNA5_CAEBR|nr:hypothetical protein L5515_009634 [Caenorhabditis briggsae]